MGGFLCLHELVTCSLISSGYVGIMRVCSLNCKNRDEPSTILRRSFGAVISCCVSAYLSLLWKSNDVSLNIHFGLRRDGLLAATVLPLLCTIILFAGPLATQILDGSSFVLFDSPHWKRQLNSLCFWRNNFIAPITEEWVFRACTLPVLTSCVPKFVSIFVGPLFFSIPHYHHMSELLRLGYEFKDAFFVCSFQAFYTYLFGVYASFVYIRTGHLIAIVLCHSFCNHMGFPEIGELVKYEPRQKAVIVTLYFVGLLLWMYLLFPLTEPTLYNL